MPSSPAIYTLSLHDALPILPGMVVLVGAVLSGVGLLGTAFAVALSSVRLTPMVVSLVPELRGSRTRKLTLYLLAHFIAITSWVDRKSTRLNSSHSQISYAVFPRDLHSFPTRRSSDLARHGRARRRGAVRRGAAGDGVRSRAVLGAADADGRIAGAGTAGKPDQKAHALSAGAFHRHHLVGRSEEHTSELQSQSNLVCRLPPRSTLFPYTTLFRSCPAWSCSSARCCPAWGCWGRRSQSRCPRCG